MRLTTHSRVTALTVGMLMALGATPAAAALDASTATAVDAPATSSDDETLAPALPPEWQSPTATAEQEAAGAPALSPGDGTRVTGLATLLATPTTEDLATITVDGQEVPTAPTLGAGDSEFQVEVGSNSMSRGYGNYLVVNGTRITILETFASETVRVAVPNELLVVGRNTITLGAGARPSSCGMNHDDFVLNDFRLALADGTEVRDTGNPGDIIVGDGNCGSNATRPRSIDLHFTVDAEPGLGSGLLHVLDTTELDDGAHRVSATTESGAVSTSEIVVDNTGPALVAASPADGGTLRGEATVDVQVDDDAGVRTGPNLTLDGQTVRAGETISSDALPAGDHELVVEAEDELGNTSRHVVTFTSVPNSPAVGGMSPASGSAQQGTDVTLGVEVTDPNADDVTTTFYAAQPSFPDTAHVGTARDLPPSQLNFTGQAEAATGALRPGDGEVLRSPAADGLTYQRFDVTVAGAAADLVVSWTGEVDPNRAVRLHVWDAEELTWQPVAESRGTADGMTELSGATGAQHLDGDVVHVLVEGYDPFADDIAEEPDGVFRDPATYDFSLVHNTDTQYLSEGAVERETAEERQLWAEAYRAIPEWVVDNAEERNIAYAFHTGDLVENNFLRTDDEDWMAQVRAEFQHASQMQSILDDAGMPNGVLAGNHDNEYGDDVDLYNEFFGPERYEEASQSWENASYGEPWRPGDNQNHYDLFTAAGLDFIAVHLSYYVTEEELAWANEVLARYPDRNAIIASHDYLSASSAPDGRGASYTAPDGQNIFDRVVSQNPNVFLVLSGHIHGVATNVRTDVAEPGHSVVEMLADYQSYEVDGERLGGFFRLLQFDVDRSEMTVDTYSPWLDNHGATEFDPNTSREYDGTEDEFTVPVDLTTRTTSFATDSVLVAGLSDEVVGTDTIASGETAEVDWEGLSRGETYAWYAAAENASDGRAVSPLATFTTAGEPGEPGEPTDPEEPGEPTDPGEPTTQRYG
ncbi:metallophosphoesterase, partial [Georgenia sp. 10Sc9-8]|nr:metallophosphoesterase [Georgenia halotolerans]